MEPNSTCLLLGVAKCNTTRKHDTKRLEFSRFQVSKEVAMSKEEAPRKTTLPKIMKLDKAFRLAEQWVNNMTKYNEDELNEVELEGRLPRLGLGATAPRQTKVGASNDPLERKLHAKLDIGKRKAAKRTEKSISSTRDGCDDKDDSEEDLDSRTKAFVKKKAVPLTSSLQTKKRKKKK